MKGKPPNRLIGYLCALSATAIWSGNFIIARGLNESIPPVSLAFWRWVVAVLVFLPFAAKPLVAERATLKKHLPYLLVTSCLGITIFNTLIYIAGQTTTAINLSLISISFPIFIVILQRLFYGEEITVYKAIGILLVVVGVVLLITKGEFAKLRELSFAIGDIWMVAAALIFAIYSILLKRKPQELSIRAFQLSTFLIGLFLLFPFFLWEVSVTPPVQFEVRTLLAILYVGVFAALTAFLLWNRAIMILGPTKAGMNYYTLPLFSGLLAFLVLGESITMVHFYSVLFILTGIITANKTVPKS